MDHIEYVTVLFLKVTLLFIKDPRFIVKIFLIQK